MNLVKAFLSWLKEKHYLFCERKGIERYLEGKNVKARPWHPNGLIAPYIGDVHDALLLAKLLPNNSGEPIYFSDVAFPVVSKEGKTLGVICTHLSWQWTRDVIRSIQKEHGVEIFLLSKDGMILVGPNNTERSNISDISSNVAQIFNSKITPTVKKQTKLSYKDQREYDILPKEIEDLDLYQYH